MLPIDTCIRLLQDTATTGHAKLAQLSLEWLSLQDEGYCCLCHNGKWRDGRVSAPCLVKLESETDIISGYHRRHGASDDNYHPMIEEMIFADDSSIVLPSQWRTQIVL